MGAGRSLGDQPTTDRPPTDLANLASLAELIERQGDEIRRLAEASPAWQFRALQAEERLKQLTAGGDAPLEHAAGTGEAERPWWRRLWER